MRAEWIDGDVWIFDGSEQSIGHIIPLANGPGPPFVCLWSDGLAHPPLGLYADGTPEYCASFLSARPNLSRRGAYAPYLDLALDAGLEIDPDRMERSLWVVRVAVWQSKATGKSWRLRARRVIEAVYSEVGTDDTETLKRALFDAYPFGERKLTPYRVWLTELKRYQEAATRNRLYLEDR